jgi:anaerobic ribonucleoside-triphosphate reductase
MINMAEEKSPIIKEAKKEVEEILSEGILKEIREFDETASFEKARYRRWVRDETIKEMKDKVRNEVEQEIKNKVKEETRQENSREIAIKLIKKGFDIDLIVQTTDLSVDEIKELQKSL